MICSFTQSNQNGSVFVAKKRGLSLKLCNLYDELETLGREELYLKEQETTLSTFLTLSQIKEQKTELKQKIDSILEIIFQ